MPAADPTAAATVQALESEKLYRATDLSNLSFTTTADLPPVDGLVGQARAFEAIQFGTRVDKAGFNLFVIGPTGARMQEAVKSLLAEETGTKPSPSDWVYVNNFANPDRPVAIELPTGRARRFHEAMHKLIDDLSTALPAVFQSEDYQTRRGAIDESFQRKHGEAFSGLRDKAAEKEVVLLRTRLAVELAQLLKLDLLGLFLEDTSLKNLANIPFARELRLLGGGWHPIDIGQMSRELEHAAQSAERMFAAAAGQLRTQCRFDIARGPMAATIARVTQTSDIVVIGEPVSAAERVAQQFSWLIEAAFRSAAAVMMVPSRIVRNHGPVVAIVTAPNDPSLAIAANFARAANEELTIVDVAAKAIEETKLRAVANAEGLAIRHIRAGGVNLPNAASVEHALGPLHERLVVMTRGPSDAHAAALLAAHRRVPLLIVEPPESRTIKTVPTVSG